MLQPLCTSESFLYKLSETISGKLICVLIILIRTLTWLHFSGQMLTFNGTLEKCALHGWIPVSTVPGRWQTVCMPSCGRGVCWCEQCPMIKSNNILVVACSEFNRCQWGYGICRHKLRTTNTFLFHFSYGNLNAQRWQVKFKDFQGLSQALKFTLI